MEEKNKVRSYEIYCRKFSQVIQAESITIAMNEFWSANPAEEIIIIEDIAARNENFAAKTNLQSPAPQSVDKEGINCGICSRIIDEESQYCEVSDCPHRNNEEFNIAKKICHKHLNSSQWYAPLLEPRIIKAMDEYSSELRKENEELRGINEGLRLSRKEYMDGFNRKVEELTLLQSTNEELGNERDAFEYNANQYSNQLDELRKENERLKGEVARRDEIIALLFRSSGNKSAMKARSMDIESEWQQFKADNNL